MGDLPQDEPAGLHRGKASKSIICLSLAVPRNTASPRTPVVLSGRLRIPERGSRKDHEPDTCGRTQRLSAGQGTVMWGTGRWRLRSAPRPMWSFQPRPARQTGTWAPECAARRSRVRRRRRSTRPLLLGQFVADLGPASPHHFQSVDPAAVIRPDRVGWLKHDASLVVAKEEIAGAVSRCRSPCVPGPAPAPPACGPSRPLPPAGRPTRCRGPSRRCTARAAGSTGY